MTAVLAPRPDPFTDAICSQSDRGVHLWDVDAQPHEQKLAAALCGGCPAALACRDTAEALGYGATGTWAGRYRPYVQAAQNPDDDVLAEYLALFGPSAATHDNPMPTQQDTKPVRFGRYWLHPAQMRIEYREAN